MDLPDAPEASVENRSEEPSKVHDEGKEAVSGMGASLTDGESSVVDSENQYDDSEAKVESDPAQAIQLDEDPAPLSQAISEDPTTGVVSQELKEGEIDANRVSENGDLNRVQTGRSKTVPILFAVLVFLGVGGYFAWAQGLFGGIDESEKRAEVAEPMDSETPTEASSQERRSTRSQNQAKDREAESLGSLEGGQTYAYPDSDPALGGTFVCAWKVVSNMWSCRH